MAKITFVHPDGRRTEVEAKPGRSVMAAATAKGIEEIAAQCGGSQACATCHVFVDEADFARLPPAQALEEELLDNTAAPRRPTSRLSCQIIISSDNEDLTVRLPERQL
jgi:2Fe-2S ferredoxin